MGFEGEDAVLTAYCECQENLNRGENYMSFPLPIFQLVMEMRVDMVITCTAEQECLNGLDNWTLLAISTRSKSGYGYRQREQ